MSGVSASRCGAVLARDGGGYRMRFVLDITVRPDGRYLGQVTVTENGARHEFGGVLELLAIFERALAPSPPDSPFTGGSE